jgi:hypothetical protein
MDASEGAAAAEVRQRKSRRSNARVPPIPVEPGASEHGDQRRGFEAEVRMSGSGGGGSKKALASTGVHKQGGSSDRLEGVLFVDSR